MKFKLKARAAAKIREELKDCSRDPMESSVELERFLVENLVTQYKRHHLVARVSLLAFHLKLRNIFSVQFHLAAFEQYMRAALPINTLFCFLLEKDTSR